MKRLGIRARIFVMTMTVIVGLLVVTHWVMRGLVDRILQAEITDSLARARQVHASFSEIRAAALADQARSVAQVPHLRAVLDTPDVDDATVSYTVTELGKSLAAALLFVTDARGRIVVETRLGRAEILGDAPELTDGPGGAESFGIWDFGGTQYLVAKSPVTLDDTVLGQVGLGYRLHDHVRDLQRVTGLDVTVVRDDVALAVAWDERSANLERYLFPPQRDVAAWSRVPLEGHSRLSAEGREYMATAVLLDGGEMRLVLSRPLDNVLQPFRRARTELLVIGIVIAGVGFLVSQWISRRIARPIRDLTDAANAVARGDLSTEIRVRSADEIGVLGRTFNDMARRLSALMLQAAEKTRAAEQASESKSIFLATMSHEIRTPLNGVLGFTEQILATELTSEQRDFAHLVQRSAQDLLGIIEDILSFAKIEAGRMQFEKTEFRTATCLTRALDSLRPAIASKGLALEIRVDPEVPEVLVGPASRLRQIVTNYAGNAVKFTARGSITVHAGLAAETPTDVLLRVEVRDTGIGIPRAHFERLFTPFTQLDSGATREYGGTGLGLAICKELAALMGGEVGLESQQGVGSTFWFTARLDKVAAVVTEPEPKPALPTPVRRDSEPLPLPLPLDPESVERRARQRILVAEDNPVNRKMIEVVLARAGWPHAVAENGKQALELMAAQAFDLVLMDCQMPTMDGLEATRRIRQVERGTGRRAPIVALTANAFEGDRDACLAAGMDDFIAKPFEAARLVAVLDRLLGVAAAR